MKYTFTLSLILLSAFYTIAQQVTKVASFPVTTQSSINPVSPDKVIALDNFLLFSADNGLTGYELWKSDGTESGTTLVKDINPGIQGSFIEHLTIAGSHAYFVANDNINGTELWKTDGTQAGTALVNNISNGATSSSIRSLIAVGNYLYFAAIANYTGKYALWRSDGTESGTIKLWDNVDEQSLTSFNGNLYFSGKNGSIRSGFYRTDGIPSGVVSVKSITPTALTSIGGLLYFCASDGTGYNGLWKSDGTEAGTTLVKSNIKPIRFGTAGQTVYFYAEEDFRHNLWKTDGTGSGTVVLKTGFKTAGGGFVEFTDYNGILYFKVEDQSNTIGLWKSDGTSQGTVQVEDAQANKVTWPNNLRVFNGKLFFSTSYNTYGNELWMIDSQNTRAVLFKDLLPGLEGSTPQRLIVLNNQLYFFAKDYQAGIELWKTDGTEVNTKVVKDINAQPNKQVLTNFTPLTNQLVFTLIYENNAVELWISDGTEAGTQKLKALGTQASYLKAVKDKVFFMNLTSSGEELWVSDGTEAGTKVVKMISSGSGSSSSVTGMIEINGELYFTTHQFALWKSDGTEQGTQLVKMMDMYANISNLTSFKGELYFSAEGQKLWKNNGTAAGTVLVKEVPPTPGYSTGNLKSFVVMNDALYFVAFDEGTYTLWKSDGTTAGTSRLISPNPGSELSGIEDLKVVGSTLYFTAYTNAIGYELWKSDGTVAGSMMVKDIVPGPESSYAGNFAGVADKLYFSSDHSLWLSDGTEEGTRPLKNIKLTTTGNSKYLGSFLPVKGTLLFNYEDNFRENGIDLWKSNGTEASTQKIHTFYINALGTTSSYSSQPRLIAIDSTVFFGDNHNTPLYELWKLTIQTNSPVQNIPPTISTIANQSIVQDSSLTLPFTITDKESVVENLTVNIVSDNTLLLPEGSLTLLKTEQNFKLIIQPASELTGTATIQVTVSDGQAMAQKEFVLTVTPKVSIPNSAPTITAIPEQNMTQDSTLTITFEVNDTESKADDLVIVASSNNQQLVPDNGLLVQGSGTTRSLTVKPTTGESGKATIHITVSDGEVQTQKEFLLTVQPKIVSSIEEYLLNKPFTVFPNPTTGVFTVFLPKANSQSVSMKVYNQLGKLVKEVKAFGIKQSLSRSIDMADLPTGIYYINITHAKERYVQKIIKY